MFPSETHVFTARSRVLRVQYHGPDAHNIFFGAPFYAPAGERVFEKGESFVPFTNALNVAFGTGGNTEYWVFPDAGEMPSR